jgi:four helix bundle protein
LRVVGWWLVVKKMGVANYKELEAWQVAMTLVEQVYRLTATFPEGERFGLTNQLRGAVVSVPSNIPEAQGCRLRKQFAMFLGIARGSAQEVETQLLLASRLGFVAEDHVAPVLRTCGSTSRLIAGLIRSIEVA